MLIIMIILIIILMIIIMTMPGGRGCFSDTSLQPFVRLGGPVAQWPLLV